MNFVELFTMSVYIITLTLVNFSRVLDEIGAINLASVSGIFASFRLQNDSCLPRQTLTCFSYWIPFFVAVFGFVFGSIFWFWSKFALAGR